MNIAPAFRSYLDPAPPEYVWGSRETIYYVCQGKDPDKEAGRAHQGAKVRVYLAAQFKFSLKL